MKTSNRDLLQAIYDQLCQLERRVVRIESRQVQHALNAGVPLVGVKDTTTHALTKESQK